MNYLSICILFVIFTASRASQFYYNRALSCVSVQLTDPALGTSRCLKWQEQTTIAMFSSYSSFCFSEGTYVMTAEGPKTMRSLGAEDQLLGMNQETGKNQFSKIKTWLHRDEVAIAKFATISTNDDSFSFEASDYHNIAFLNAEGKIDFNFTKNLQQGDKLVSFPEKNFSVKTVGNYQEKNGLYSPFTQIGNYYVYHENFDIRKHLENGQNEEPMILVHVLSQITNPNTELSIANKFINSALAVGYDQQPLSETYVNPLISSWNFLFGSNWNGTLQQIKYKVQNNDNHNQITLNHEYYSSSSSAARQRRNNQLKGLGLSLSVIMELPFF